MVTSPAIEEEVKKLTARREAVLADMETYGRFDSTRGPWNVIEMNVVSSSFGRSLMNTALTTAEEILAEAKIGYAYQEECERQAAERRKQDPEYQSVKALVERFETQVVSLVDGKNHPAILALRHLRAWLEDTGYAEPEVFQLSVCVLRFFMGEEDKS